MSSAASPSTVIELSTVYFCRGAIPHVISLHDSSLALRGASPEALIALYGNQSKQEGFMAAREYAERQRLNFTVIDFLVALDYRINPGLMKADEFGAHDFLAFQRLARSGSDEIAAMLQASVGMKMEATKPAAVLLERPALISSLFGQAELEHMKVIAFQAKPAMSERALNVGVVPYRHWDAVVEATCRLNPTTRVSLDRPRNPSPSPSDALKPVAPATRLRSKAPRAK